MKKHKQLLAFTSLILLFLIAGCFSNPVQDDLLKYVNEDLAEIVELEEEVIAEYESVVGVNYVDDWTTYVHLDEVVIPKYQDFVTKLEAIRPGTNEVRDVHEIYIEGVNKQLNAMMKILIAIERQDLDGVMEANEMLDEGRAILRKFANELEDLGKEHNVEFEELDLNE